MNDRTVQQETKVQKPSNDNSCSQSPLRQSHLTPLDASSIRYQVNYIKQFFQVKDLFNIPEISISCFYQKIHKLRAILREQIQNPKLYLQTEYKIRLPIKLSSLFESNAQNIENKIKQTDVINFQLVIEDISTKLLSIYFGQVQNDKKSGYGVYALFEKQDQSNQKLLSLYEGFYDCGLKNGVGLQWERDTLYIGNFVNDLQFTYQSSVILYDSGDLYVGSMINKRRSGKGVYFKLKTKKNQFYKYQSSKKALDYEYLVAGLWQNDKIAVNNNLLMTTGLKDILQIDLFKFPANLLVKNNSIYCGDIIQKIQITKQKQEVFLKNGKGFEFFCNGDIYKGQYAQDKPHGFGRYIWANKEEYLGQIRGGIRQGKGKWISQNGESFEGEYEADQRCGYGIYKWPNGDCYQGQFKDDLRNGLGKMSWSNGQTYIGYWKRGLQHGEGQIHINLRFANFHKKMKFNKGSPVIKTEDISKHLSENIRQRILTKNKMTDLSVDKNKLNQKKYDTPTQMKRRSLGQLKLTKKHRFTSQKFQNHSKSLLHQSFQQLRQKYDEKALNKDKKEILIQQENKNQKTEVDRRKSEENQMYQYSQQKAYKNKLLLLESKLKSFTEHTPIKRKLYCHNKFVMKKKNVHNNCDSLGETLLKPIKWANFKQSWEQKNY